MDEKTIQNIIILINLASTRRSSRQVIGKNKKDKTLIASEELALLINYHNITNVSSYAVIGGREAPAIQRICVCGWKSEPYTSIKEAILESNLHEVSNSANYEVD